MCLRLHSAGSTWSHLWPTGSSFYRLRPGTSPQALRIPLHSGHPALRWLATGQRGITPAFGYDAPHLSVRGTSTLLIYALPSAHYEPLRLLIRLLTGFHVSCLHLHPPQAVRPGPNGVRCTGLYDGCGSADLMRSLLFHRLLSYHPGTGQHNQSPSCTGCLLPGRLFVTRKSSPASQCAPLGIGDRTLTD